MHPLAPAQILENTFVFGVAPIVNNNDCSKAEIQELRYKLGQMLIRLPHRNQNRYIGDGGCIAYQASLHI